MSVHKPRNATFVYNFLPSLQKTWLIANLGSPRSFLHSRGQDLDQKIILNGNETLLATFVNYCRQIAHMCWKII